MLAKVTTQSIVADVADQWTDTAPSFFLDLEASVTQECWCVWVGTQVIQGLPVPGWKPACH